MMTGGQPGGSTRTVPFASAEVAPLKIANGWPPFPASVAGTSSQMTL